MIAMLHDRRDPARILYVNFANVTRWHHYYVDGTPQGGSEVHFTDGESVLVYEEPDELDEHVVAAQRRDWRAQAEVEYRVRRLEA